MTARVRPLRGPPSTNRRHGASMPPEATNGYSPSAPLPPADKADAVPPLPLGADGEPHALAGDDAKTQTREDVIELSLDHSKAPSLPPPISERVRSSLSKAVSGLQRGGSAESHTEEEREQLAPTNRQELHK